MRAFNDHAEADIRRLESREMILRAECQKDVLSQDQRSTCFSKATVKPSAKQTESERFELESKREDLKHFKQKLELLEQNLMRQYAKDLKPQMEIYMSKLNEIRQQRVKLIDKDLGLQAQLSQLDKQDLQEPVENAFFPDRKSQVTRKKTGNGFLSDLSTYRQKGVDIEQAKLANHEQKEIDRFASPAKVGFTFTISDESYFKAVLGEGVNRPEAGLEKEREQINFGFDKRREPSVESRNTLRQKMDSEEPPNSFKSRNIFLNDGKKEQNGILFGNNRNLEKSLMRRTFQSLAAPSIMEPERVIRNIQRKRDPQSRELLHPRDTLELNKFSLSFLDTPKRSNKDSPISYDLHDQNERLLKMNKRAAIACKKLTFKSCRATMNFYEFPEHALRRIPNDCQKLHDQKGCPDNDCDSTDSVVRTATDRGLKYLFEGLADRNKGLPRSTGRTSNR